MIQQPLVMPAAGILLMHWSRHCAGVSPLSAISGSEPFVQDFAVDTIVHDSGVTFFVNVAVTDFAAVIDTPHAPLPVQAPVQPVNVDPDVAAGVSVTLVL